MLKHELLRDDGLLVLTPEAPLEAEDFEILKDEIDPYIEQTGQLKGLLIQAESFPGWDSLAAFLSHLKFIKDHHQKIAKVAAVTDSGFLSIMPRVASHFIQAEIRHFPYQERDAAMAWLRSSSKA